MESTPMGRGDHPGEDTPRRDVAPPSGDVLEEVLGRFSAIETSPEARALVAQVLAATLMAFTRTRSVRDSLPDTAPESAEEALAVLAGVDQLRASLAAIDASWQVAAEDRIRRDDLARGVPSSKQGRGAGQEIALARRISPSTSSFSLAKARRLTQNMPSAIERLWAGAMTDQQASAVSGALDGANADTCHRVDDHLREHPEFLQGKGYKRLRSDTQKLVQQLEPETSRQRAERAARARHVRMTPLADGMARVTAVLRGVDAAGLMNSLNTRAESLRVAGAKASVPALEADLLVDDVLRGGQAEEPGDQHVEPRDQHVTPDDQHITPSDPGAEPVDPVHEPGASEKPEEARESQEAQEAHAAGAAPEVDAAEQAAPRMPRTRPGLDVGIVISDTALLGQDDGSETAELEGYGTIPAHIIRDTLLGQPPGHLRADEDEHPDDVVSAFYRRLYRSPRTGDLIAMESRARVFPAGLARMIRWRDTTCRTPWCNAKIRHIDHVVPHHKGGPTSYANGQGLCVRCNLLKELGLWVLSPLSSSHAAADMTAAGNANGPATETGAATGTGAEAETGIETETGSEADDSGTALADPSSPPRAWIWSSPHGAMGTSFTPSQLTPSEFTPWPGPPPEKHSGDEPKHDDSEDHNSADNPDCGDADDESEPPETPTTS
ncbi:MAG: HNH endonuclease [Brachybacterium sp.]|uniref:HNH endonuclease n=1 Tax=unclassified Brachybacterium TaxID=2623841 RepID=UPI003F97FD9E